MKEYYWEPREEFFPEDEEKVAFEEFMDFEDVARFVFDHECPESWEAEDEEPLDLVGEARGVISGEPIEIYVCRHCGEKIYAYAGKWAERIVPEEDL